MAPLHGKRPLPAVTHREPGPVAPSKARLAKDLGARRHPSTPSEGRTASHKRIPEPPRDGS